MCVSSLASAGAILTSFFLLTGTSQFSDWGLYAHRHQSILKEFRCHCRLSPSLCMLPIAGHCQPRLILAVPLGCPGLESLSEHSDGLLCPSPEGDSSIIWQGGLQLAPSTVETHHGALCVLFFPRPPESCKTPDKLWGRELLQTAYFSFMTRPRRKLEANVLPCTCMV